MKTYREILSEKIRLKKVHAGSYEATIGRVSIRVYKAELADYWSSTIEVGTYGDDDWQEESFQANSKRDLVRDIETFIRKHN